MGKIEKSLANRWERTDKSFMQNSKIIYVATLPSRRWNTSPSFSVHSDVLPEGTAWKGSGGVALQWRNLTNIVFTR